MISGIIKKKKVLLVDDDEIHLTIAELYLKDEYEVCKTRSGNEALEYLSGNESVPDIILLDIVMPNMSGWEVLKKLKAMDHLKNVPIVFLTTIAEEKEIQRAHRMGIADYITKPFNMVDLRSRIKDVLNGYRMKAR